MDTWKVSVRGCSGRLTSHGMDLLWDGLLGLVEEDFLSSWMGFVLLEVKNCHEIGLLRLLREIKDYLASSVSTREKGDVSVCRHAAGKINTAERLFSWLWTVDGGRQMDPISVLLLVPMSD